jgi:hypothetical protein
MRHHPRKKKFTPPKRNKDSDTEKRWWQEVLMSHRFLATARTRLDPGKVIDQWPFPTIVLQPGIRTWAFLTAGQRNAFVEEFHNVYDAKVATDAL